MKKFIALILALISGWILFLPIDFPFFIDEAIALPVFIGSMKALGFDITRFIPFLKGRSKKNSAAQPDSSPPPSGPTIDV